MIERQIGDCNHDYIQATICHECGNGWCVQCTPYCPMCSPHLSPARIRQMADGEDTAGCVSVGGLAVETGQPVHPDLGEKDMLRLEIARLNLVIDELASSLSKQTLKPAITERRMAEKTVHTRPWKNSLVQAALWELVKDPDDEEAGPGDLYWEGSHTGVDREWRLDDLVLKPEHFKPGAVVIVMEPNQ